MTFKPAWAAMAAAVVLAGGEGAAAAVITSLPGGVAQPMPAIQYFGMGPQAFGDGITWTSEGASSVFGYTGSYGFGNNPFWSSTPMAGTNDVLASMYFTFASPVSAFLAELNWSDLEQEGPGGVFLQAYDSNNVLLESLQLAGGGSNLVAPGYYGFQRAGNEIATIRLSEGYIGLRNLSISRDHAAIVPEPTTWALMILGFGAAGAMLRRRELSTAAA